MAPRSSKKTTSTPVVESSSVETVPEVVKKPRAPRKTSTPVESAPPVAVSEPVVESTEPRTRRKVTKENVLEEFDSMVEALASQTEELRQNPKHSVGLKFLKSFAKRLTTLRKDSSTAMKMKRVRLDTEKKNTTSGFQKPVKISKEMAKFTGWNEDQLRSRTDVTKYLCEYIKTNNLQNPVDRRQIVVDKRLGSLLRYDPKTEEKALTYYSLQQRLAPHFVKTEVQA